MAKRLRDMCGLPEDEKLWKAGRGFVVRDLPWTEEKLRKIDAERKKLRESGAVPQITGREGKTAETGGKGAQTRMGNNISEGELDPSETPAGAAREQDPDE